MRRVKNREDKIREKIELQKKKERILRQEMARQEEEKKSAPVVSQPRKEEVPPQPKRNYWVSKEQEIKKKVSKELELKQKELEKIEKARQKIEKQFLVQNGDIGDYFECIRCDKLTIHVDRQTICENQACPSNIKSNFSPENSPKKTELKDLKHKDEFALKMEIITQEKKFHKHLKEKDGQISQLKKDLTSTIQQNEDLKDQM